MQHSVNSSNISCLAMILCCGQATAIVASTKLLVTYMAMLSLACAVLQHLPVFQGEQEPALSKHGEYAQMQRHCQLAVFHHLKHRTGAYQPFSAEALNTIFVNPDTETSLEWPALHKHTLDFSCMTVS